MCLFFAATPLYAAPLTVTVVLSEQGAPYLEFTEALREKFLKKNVHLNIVTDSTSIIPEQGVVIAAGMKAATAVAGNSRVSAILNVLIPETGFEKLQDDFPRRAGSKSFSAIYLDQHTERHIRLIKALLPGKRHVGLLFDTYPQDELAELRQRLARHKLVLHEQKVSDKLPAYAALQEVLKESEVLLALPETSIYNSLTIRNILLAAYRNGSPMIGFTPSYVKAGALAAVYSTPAQVAEQAVQAILQYGETRTLPPAQHPQLFEVLVNEQVGQSLGLPVKSAAELRQEISAITGDEP